MDIEKLRQKVLDLAIRGKLVPQDPNDEPASVLIERIRGEKAKLVKEGKIKASKEESYIYKGSDNCYYEKINNQSKKIELELFDLPHNWQWVKLGDIFDIGSSKRVHKADWTDSGIPFYRARDIELLNDNIFKSELYISNAFYEELKRKYGIPQINDILITAVGTLGKTYIIKDNSPFYYKDGNIICLSNLFKINPDYIQLLYLSSFIKNQLNQKEGTTVNTYTITVANNTYIPLPPICEQEKIVNSFKTINDNLKFIHEQINSLNLDIIQLKQKILEDIFGSNSSYKSYYENLVPITTDVSIFDNKRKPINSDERARRIENKKLLYPYYGATGQTGFIDEYIFDGEFVLVGEDGAPFLDKTAIKAYLISGKTWVNNHAHVLQSSTNNKFLMYYLNWFDYLNYVGGTTRLKLNQANLKNIPIPKMPTIIKEEIVYKIEKAFSILDLVNGV